MREHFVTGEGLRQVLNRLHDLDMVGYWAWRTDPEAERLMRFVIRKYRWLAVNHGCDPEDSAYAAFDAMRTRAVRLADDPWAVVTRAVQVSLIAEERAAGLLCSNPQARRHVMWGRHDARRFCEYENDVLEYHPAMRAPALLTPEVDPHFRRGAEPNTSPAQAGDMVIALLVSLGWPENTATCAVDYITTRLTESKNRPAAHSLLRRDEMGRAALDLDRESWGTLLRLVLGDPEPEVRNTLAGHGLLTLFLCGYTPVEFLADDDLVAEISQTAPKTARRTDPESAGRADV